VPTRIVVISDTHLPKRAKTLPETLWRAIEEADVVIHAGDWVEVALLDELSARATRVIGVWGNNDGPDLRARLPEIAGETIDGIRFAVIHETGSSQGREARMDEQFPDADVLVFGHSHIPWDTATPRGLRLLNPGSPTDRRRQPAFTFMTATADNGNFDVETITLPAHA
jgi:putative phosphoesterase